jgi:hypothetical protein
MSSIRKQYREWIKANKQEKDMTAETLERLYDVMLEMEAVVDNPNVSAIPVDRIEKWFHFLQFSVIKELAGKNEVMVIKGEIKDAIEKRALTENCQSEHQD